MKIAKKPGFKRVTLSLSPEAVVKLEQLTSGKNKSKFVEKLVDREFKEEKERESNSSENWFVEFRKRNNKFRKSKLSAVELIRFDRYHGH